MASFSIGSKAHPRDPAPTVAKETPSGEIPCLRYHRGERQVRTRRFPMRPAATAGARCRPAPCAMIQPMNAASSTQPPPAELLARARTIAVVGFSADPSKPSHRAPMELVRRGWNVIPVNPTVTEVAGMKAYATLADVPVPVDLVDVFRPSAEAPDIARQAAEIGARTLWLQKGITSTEARDIAAAAGMAFVEDECAGATAAQLNLSPPVS